MICFVCLKDKELKSTFVCADCVDMPSERASIKQISGPQLMKALRRIGRGHQIIKEVDELDQVGLE